MDWTKKVNPITRRLKKSLMPIIAGIVIALGLGLFAPISFAQSIGQYGNYQPTTQLNPMLCLMINRPASNSFAQAEADGFTSIRIDTFWSTIETNVASYDWSGIDAKCALCLQYHLKPLWILDDGNTNYGVSCTSTGITAFVRFVTNCVYRVAANGLTGCHWEIWNEPENFSWYGNNLLTAAQVAQLNNASVVAIHAADPTAKVSCSAYSSYYNEEGFGLSTGGNTAFAAGMATNNAFDAIGIHTYGTAWQYGTSEGAGIGGFDDNPECDFGGEYTYQTFTLEVQGTPGLANMQTYWETETGIQFALDAGSDETKFSYEWIRTILCHWMVGFQFITVYNDTDPTWGLFPGGNLHQANHAIQFLTLTTAGKTITSMTTPIGYGQLPTNNGIWSVTLSGSPAVMIAWVPEGTAQVNGPPNSTCTDMYGTNVTLSNNSVTMSESNGVYYFTGAAPPMITMQPTNATVTIGGTANFTVAATGTAPIAYQWRQNGTNLSGATATNYITPSTVAGNNGATFCCVVTNSAGSVTSSVVTLTVQPPAPPEFSSLTLAENNLIIAGTNGPANATYYLLASTDLTLPLTNWTLLATNVLDAQGNFVVTNVLNPYQPRQFYRLILP